MSSEIPVNLSSISDSHDQNEKPVVFHLIDDPKVTHADPVQLFRRLELRGIAWPWILFQLFDPGKNPLLRFAIELADLATRGRCDLDGVVHEGGIRVPARP